MPKRPYQRSLKTRVPVSTTGNRSPKQESHTGPIGLNSLHEARIVTSLVDHYGWMLCADGNLYNPRPGAGAHGA